MGGAHPGVPPLPAPLLTPELRERLQRMAVARGVAPHQVLEEAITNEWLRYGARRRLKPGEW